MTWKRRFAFLERDPWILKVFALICISAIMRGILGTHPRIALIARTALIYTDIKVSSHLACRCGTTVASIRILNTSLIDLHQFRSKSSLHELSSIIIYINSRTTKVRQLRVSPVKLHLVHLILMSILPNWALSKEIVLSIEISSYKHFSTQWRLSFCI